MSLYIIKSALTPFVLDVEGGGRDGAKVIPWDKHGGDNQVWYDDPSTGTIRTKAGNFCLDIENNQLVVKNYQAGDPNQQWVRQGPHIRNRVDNNKVLDIAENKKEKGARIGSWAFNGGPNQSWEFETVGGQAPVTGASTGAARRFQIVSELAGKVLDVEAAKTTAGAKILMWDKKTPATPNQLWYLDQQGFIRSALNDMVFSNGGNAQVLKTEPASGNPRSQWTLEGRKIASRAGEALDITRANKDNGAEVISYSYKDQANQHWRFEYV
jgi:hypothetical protein